MEVPFILRIFLFDVVFGAVIFGTAALAIHWRRILGRSPLRRTLGQRGVAVSNGTVYELKTGQQYRVKQDFCDHYNGEFKAGDTLTFLKRDFLPYHGGHTIQFREANLYLQDEENADILQSLWDYLEPIS